MSENALTRWWRNKTRNYNDGMNYGEWEAYKAEAMRKVVENWAEREGTCNVCQLPMRLHPSGRAYSSDIRYCFAAQRAHEASA